MRDARSLDNPRAFKLDRRSVQVVEQADTPTEQDGQQVDLYYVKQPGRDALLHDARAADGDSLVPRGLLCLANGTFSAICDEGEGRAFTQRVRDPCLWDGMGHLEKSRRNFN